MSSPYDIPLPGRRRWLRRGWAGRWLCRAGAGAFVLLLVLWPLSYGAQFGAGVCERPWYSRLGTGSVPAHVCLSAKRGVLQLALADACTPVWTPYSCGSGGERMPGLRHDAKVAVRWNDPRASVFRTPHLNVYVGVRLWWVLAALGALLAVRPWWAWRRRVRRKRGPPSCGECVYDLRASVGRCPECGTPIAPAGRRLGRVGRRRWPARVHGVAAVILLVLLGLALLSTRAQFYARIDRSVLFPDVLPLNTLIAEAILEGATLESSLGVHTINGAHSGKTWVNHVGRTEARTLLLLALFPVGVWRPRG